MIVKSIKAKIPRKILGNNTFFVLQNSIGNLNFVFLGQSQLRSTTEILKFSNLSIVLDLLGTSR